MTTHRSLGTVVEGAIVGGLLALVMGLVWVALAPANGFGDLVAAAVTPVVLVPVGVVVGALVGYRNSARPHA
jgi:hypothetical protein